MGVRRGPTYVGAMTPLPISRRSLLLGGLGLAGLGGLAACSGPGTGIVVPERSIPSAPSVTPAPGQNVVTAALTPKQTTIDLAGQTLQTWAYGDEVPGKVLRANAGDFLRVFVDNQLPADTTVHWHGIRLRNAADGVPGVTQNPIAPGAKYVYEFTAPDPGTYFFHPHVGVQLDRGLYAPLIIDDPDEPGAYDLEWVIVLDDWLDGTGTNPDEVLKRLMADNGQPNSGGMGGMGGMGHGGMGGMGGGTAPWGDAGDIVYPYFLVNGRPPADPSVFTGKPGQRVRMRIINAASDTIFTVALGGHRMTITHTDGHAVQPTDASAFYIGMGERYDAIVTLADGAFPLVAQPFGKSGQAMAVVRTGSGSAPSPGTRPAELTGQILVGSDLRPAESALLPARNPDSTVDLVLNGQMQPFQWGMNGAPYGQNTPLTAEAGKRLRINLMNMTMMTHPIHLHGPAFALANTGLRKDTLLVPPMGSVALDVDPDAGDWMVHCHNIYHAEAGMMIVLSVSG